MQTQRLQTTSVPTITSTNWKARKAKFKEPLDGLPNVVVLTNTGTPPCTCQEECMAALRTLQQRHMDQGHPDILYNFIFGGDGNVYEGRGWDTCSGEVPGFPKEKTITFAFIENFTTDKEQEYHRKMGKVFGEFLHDAHRYSRIDYTYKLVDKFVYDFEKRKINYIYVLLVGFPLMLYALYKYR